MRRNEDEHPNTMELTLSQKFFSCLVQHLKDLVGVLLGNRIPCGNVTFYQLCHDHHVVFLFGIKVSMLTDALDKIGKDPRVIGGEIIRKLCLILCQS